MDALSFSLCVDTTSLAHRDAVRGERHPPHLKLSPTKVSFESVYDYDPGEVDNGKFSENPPDSSLIAKTVYDVVMKGSGRKLRDIEIYYTDGYFYAHSDKTAAEKFADGADDFGEPFDEEDYLHASEEEIDDEIDPVPLDEYLR